MRMQLQIEPKLQVCIKYVDGVRCYGSVVFSAHVGRFPFFLYEDYHQFR